MINFALIQQSLPALLHGMLVTLQIAFFGCAIGLTLGLILGPASSAKNMFLRVAIGAYTTLFRGTPMLIQILFIYSVLPQFGIYIHAFWGAVLAIGLNSSAYISHIIRSGITSVSTGQVEAAKTLGLNTWHINRHIILPQAIRVVLPALGNEFITLIKDSSLASTIGVVELAKSGAIIASRTLDMITIYCAVALLYLVMTTTIALIMNKLEQRMNRHVRA